MVPRLVATSATIIPCGGNASSKPLSIPVKSNQTADEGMSLIVQLGTTNVGYTPTLTTAVVSSGTANRSVNFRPQQVTTNQQPTSVAKHRLPMQINRQPPQVNRTLLGQQHAALPVRNIAALARPISQPLASASSGKPVPQHSAPSPTVAGRVLASPVKDSTLDDDLLEGVVEKRPKYHKHLPLSYQYVLQDHNYGAPPPPTPSTPPKPLVNGVSTANGLTRSQPPTSQQVPNIASNSFNVNRSKSVQQPSTTTAFGNATMTNVFGIGTRGAAPPAEESDVESTDGEREVDPQGEETETAPEEGEEDIEEDSVTRCICEMQHDDGYMICCDKCFVWQHVACMGLDRNNIPDTYMCEKCQPRRVDKQKAIALQLRKKREQLLDTSDSSSDTSSGSNAAKIPLGKPNVPVNNRRRSEPTQRKNSASNAKQRRESSKEHGAPRQNKQATNKKKQAEKRPPARRKSSQPGINNNPLVPEKSSPVEKKVTTPTTPVEQLRQWIDSYEEAVTNHYSPELRARVASIKVNGIHSDLKLPTNLMTTPKCRVSLLPSGIKILVACVSISGNQPLLELRGKYMLCGSGPANRPPRIATPLPGPYIFHYKLPRDNTEVCVDARTYGNDARFVRRSCKPNSEMRHCIEKGALHLYLVTTKAIDKNTEITLAMAPGLTCVICGDSCTSATPLSPSDTHKSLNGLISPTNNNNTQITDKRRRGRRRTMSENLSPPKAAAKVTPKPPPKSQALSKVSSTPKPTSKIVPSVRVPTPPPRVPTPPPEPVIEKARTPSPPPPPTPPPPSPPARSPSPPSPPPPAPTTRSAASIAARKPPTSPKKESPPENITSTRQQKREAADKKKKMTREERKMEAIMKAFERMEKDQARKQEAQARQTQRKDSTETDSKDKIEPKEKEKEKDRGSEKEEPLTNNNRSSQRKRKFSTTKRKSRGRSQSTPQPTLRPRRTLRRSQPTRDRSPDSAESSDESPIRQRLRTPAPSTPLKTPPVTPTKQDTPGRNDFSKQNFESPPHNQVNSSPSSGETPPTPMSKTAMLIAAAVGPLAPGFKFPMTKKGLINSWLKSPESSPPALPEELPPRGQGFNATKKRWLRQAISEECDSPNGRPEASNSPSEHVAPPKKRRLARESVSEDHSTFTPPSTPTHTAEALNQMTDEEDTVSSPQDKVKPAQECPDDACGSSQDSEGPESPAAAAASVKPKVEIKNEEEATEESEDDVPLKQVSVKEEEKKDGIGSGKTVTIKEDLDTKEGVSFKEEKESNAEKKESKKPGAAASASATKRKLSISEYRQRKQQGPGTVGQKSPGKPDRPNSPTTSATSSMSSSSSEDEDETPNNVIAKSLMLEAALDSTLSKKPPLFDSAPTLVERQRENLTQRLKREFGLFLSDDEESDKTRKQGNGDVLNREKEKDLGKKKNLLPPPPPPVEPPQYPTAYFPGVGHPMYSNRFASVPPPATLVDSQYYSNNSSAYYSQLPH